MKFPHLLLSATAATLTLVSPAMAETPASRPVAPTIEQLAAFPAYSSFTLSPDGKHIAALEARGEDRVIVVWPADNLAGQPKVLASSEMKISAIQFIKNDLLAVTLWQPYDSRLDGVVKTFLYKLYITDLQGKNWREPMLTARAKTELEEEIRKTTQPTILDPLPADPDHILVLSAESGSEGDVYKVNLRNMRSEKILRTDRDTTDYVTDLAGNIRARLKAGIDGSGAYVAAEFRGVAGGAWEEHFRSYVKDRDEVGVVGFTADPNVVILRSNKGADKASLYEYHIAERKMGEVLFGHKFFDATSARTLRASTNPQVPAGTILAFEYNGPTGGDTVSASNYYDFVEASVRKALGIRATPTRLVDPATGQAANVPIDADLQVRIGSISQDLSRALVVTQGPNQPPVYYLLDGNRLKLLARTYPDLDPRALGMTRLVYYKARDGLDIPALLTKPSETLCGAGPWKTVIHPHGGPWARDELGFDGSMWVPLMASRCMAVLQPQYRGSFGWGRRLNKEGDAEWGGKMQDDKDDGAKWLIEQGVARPNQIAMFGFSYGGYASMDAAVRPNGIYKCAISGAGVSDIKTIWKRFYTNRFYQDGQGPTVKGVSPLDFADKIKIPIMVYHGDRDRTVPIEQSEWFVAKAKKSGQPVVYHAFKDYAHGPAWTRAIMAAQLKAIEDYLLTDCGGSGL